MTMSDVEHMPSGARWAPWRLIVTLRGPDGKQVYTVDKPFARVGGDPRSEVVLPFGPPRRLYLHATEAGVFVMMLEPGDAPTIGRMPPGKSISLGDYRLSAKFDRNGDGPPTSSEAPSMTNGLECAGPELEITSLDGAQPPTRLHVRSRLTLVGREPPAKMRLVDASVSKCHCLLYWDDRRLWVVDLFSSGGTVIEGRGVDSALLAPGEQLNVGSFRLTYLEPSRPVQPAPSAPHQRAPMHPIVAAGFAASTELAERVLNVQMAKESIRSRRRRRILMASLASAGLLVGAGAALLVFGRLFAS